MRFKKLLLCSLPVVALAFAVTIGGSLFHTPEAEAGGFCLPTLKTAHGWAAGNTCAAARSACAADVWNDAEMYNCNTREVCAAQAISYGACNPVGNQFHTDCTMKHRCTGPSW